MQLGEGWESLSTADTTSYRVTERRGPNRLSPSDSLPLLRVYLIRIPA